MKKKIGLENVKIDLLNFSVRDRNSCKESSVDPDMPAAYDCDVEI